MGKLYAYRLNIGDRRTEAIYTTKAEAEKGHKIDSRIPFRKPSKIMIKQTPYIIPVMER